MKRGILAVLVGGIMLFQFVALTSTQKLEAGYEYRDMSCYELWYERNRIFARKGYCFTTRRAIRTFGRGCFPPYGRLSGWEEDEVDEIKYWERRKRCRY
jgi:hypothetical protein